MLSTNKDTVAIVLAAAFLGFFGSSSPAFAHEARTVGAYHFEVGWHLEPTFRGFPNAFEIIVTRASDDVPINVKMGDVLNFTVEVQLRERESFDARILQSAKLQDQLRQDEDVVNQYNMWVLPTVVGTYAFHITGTVSDDSQADGVGQQSFDMTFVCGNGSRDSKTDFDCVKAPQLFPSGQ